MLKTLKIKTVKQSHINYLTSHNFLTLAVFRTLSALERSLFKEKNVKEMNALIIYFASILYLAANTQQKKCKGTLFKVMEVASKS